MELERRSGAAAGKLEAPDRTIGLQHASRARSDERYVVRLYGITGHHVRQWLARRLGAGLQSSVFFYLLATLCSYGYAVQAGATVPHFASAQGGTPKPPARTHLLLGHGPPRSSGQECNQTLRRAL